MSVVAALALIFAMVVVFPVSIFVSGAVVAAVQGWLHTEDAEDRFEGSELLPLSK